MADVGVGPTRDKDVFREDGEVEGEEGAEGAEAGEAEGGAECGEEGAGEEGET